MDKNSPVRAIIRNVIILLVTVLLVWATTPYTQTVHQWPLIAILAVVAYLVHWLAFIPAFIRQTEKFYDLTGMITYLSVMAVGMLLTDNRDARTLLVAALVSIWTLRLGLFLFMRIMKDGKDVRFDEIKPNALRFFTAWTISGLWVFLTAFAALMVMTSVVTKPLGAFALLGCLLWVIGFAIEVAADRQKRVFRRNPDNQGKFITSGLWAWSRHPNYFGEILLWVGVFVIAIPVLQGWQWLAILSPVFVYLLLTRLSGVPMLEEIADKRWGGQADYEAYKAQTPILMMKPPQ